MKPEQVAAQLYTVRTHTQTPNGLRDALKRVRALGYRAVEISGHGPVEDSELTDMLAETGLVCCSSHEGGELLFENIDAVIRRLHALKCPIATYPWPGGIDFGTFDSVRAFAEQLNEVGRILKENGIIFCYHNHHMEFRRLEGRTVLDILADEVSPEDMRFELDTYWTQYGGGNPAAWCRKLAGRLEILHLKDYAINERNEVTFSELGQGNLDWEDILARAEEAGCRWFAVEQDETPADPFQSLEVSLRYLQACHL